MAYHLHHKISFNNSLNEAIYIELHKKDAEPDQVTNLLAVAFKCSYQKGDGDKFDTILSQEAVLTLWLQNTDSVEFDDFIVSLPDEWKMIAYDDDQIIFVGFLTPGEGRAEFQDKPYEVKLSATDGLGLLKAIPLSNNSGVRFTGVSLIIDYALAILNKTDLGLGLRVYSNITEESMQDRSLNEFADTLNQTGLHARTFLKDSIEFYDCYKALEIILSEYFSLYQWHGMWVILRIGEMQESPGAKMWYTDYDSAGNIIGAAQSNDNACAVGRDHEIHAVEVNQTIGSEFAVKLSKYTYNYNTWPELPTNNKFEYGDFIDEGAQNDEDDVDGDGNTSEIIGTYKQYTINNWEFGKLNAISASFPFVLSPPDGTARVKRIYNEFGTEIDRQIIIDTPLSNTHWLRCEAIPVTAGDRIEISLQKKFRNDFTTPSGFTGATIAARCYVVNDAVTEFWGLHTASQGGDIPEGVWRKGSLSQLVIFYTEDQDSRKYAALSVSSMPMPVNGNLYIAFNCGGPIENTGPEQIYRDFNFRYIPYIAGGYIQVKGDYAQTEQNTLLKDKIEVEVSISDTLKKVLKGSLFRADLQSLTTPTWRRFNIVEARHFKELGELARYNNCYRRMWKIIGTFDGVKFKPYDNPLVIEPLSFHRHFTFPDSSKLNGRYFMIVPPLNIDYANGTSEFNFVEVLHEGSTDGNNTGDIHTPIKFIFD